MEHQVVTQMIYYLGHETQVYTHKHKKAFELSILITTHPKHVHYHQVAAL